MTYSRDDDPEHAAEVKEATRRMREFNLEESRRPSEKKHSENAQSPPATPSPPATDIPFTQEELDQMAHDDAVEAARRRLQDMIHGEKVDAAARRMADLHVKEAERKAEADQEEAKRRAVRAAKEASFRQRVPRPPGQERKWSSQDHPHYMELRRKEDIARDERDYAWKASTDAHDKGDKRAAKVWSNERKRCQEEVERLNAEASEFIFNLNNKDLPLSRVDLHGLYVKEASLYAERAILQARQRGDPKVHLIVGKGKRSQDKIAVIKPAMERLAKSLGLVANLRPGNDGVLIVQLDDPKRS